MVQKAVWIPSRKLGSTRLHADHVIYSTKDSLKGQTVSSYIDDLSIVALKVTSSVTRVEDEQRTAMSIVDRGQVS